MVKKNKAQVWVETAIYTLIGISIIAIILYIGTPQVMKMKDKSIVLQTYSALNDLNKKIKETAESPGNVRNVKLKIAKGEIEIIPELYKNQEKIRNSSIKYILKNSELQLSEPGVVIKDGDFKLLTEKHGSRYNIIVTLEYENYKVTSGCELDQSGVSCSGGTNIKVLNSGGASQNIIIENIGDNDPDQNPHIDIKIMN